RAGRLDSGGARAPGGDRQGASQSPPSGCLRRAEAGPRVVSRDVDVRPIRLLRARWRSKEVDVRPEEVLDSDEVAGRELKDKKLVRRSAIRKTGSSGKRRQSLTWRRADFPCRVGQRPDARPSRLGQLVR